MARKRKVTKKMGALLRRIEGGARPAIDVDHTVYMTDGSAPPHPQTLAALERHGLIRKADDGLVAGMGQTFEVVK